MPDQSVQDHEYKALQGQFNIDEALGVVECFVAGIGNKDSVGDIVAPGAFTESLKRRKPRVVWGHNWNEPIGKVLEMYEVSSRDPRLPLKMKQAGIGGLYAKVQFNLKSERGRQAFADVAFFGEEQEWSIGYKTLDADFDPQRQANVLKKVELYEASPVLHGANQLTGTISIKTLDTEKVEKMTPCWDGYMMVGMKKGKNGKMVPNCVPIEKKSSYKDPDGGLTAEGRAHFNRTEGSNLKPGVKGPANTPEKMRRKGSFLTRFFTNPSGPMKDEKGESTRLALSASAWGEPVPQDASDAQKLAQKGRALLERYNKTKDYDTEAKNHERDNNYNDEGTPAKNPQLGRLANLALALATKFGGAVRVRESDGNSVTFDHRNQNGEMTVRVSYHYENNLFMFGKPTRVKPTMVYLPIDADNLPSGEEAERRFEDRYRMDADPQVPFGVKPKSPEKADPLGGIVPQELVTGDILRGRGPRRGNLEKLLRYWRPIMKKPGGFRRCRVILANHPELFPLSNICAWLHHETTGLWPNEGCHHPGMKNCRKKLKKQGWDNSEFDNHISALGKPGKSLMSISEDDIKTIVQGFDDDEKGYAMMEELASRLAQAKPEEAEQMEETEKMADFETDDEELANQKSYEALKQFMNDEPDFINYLADKDNWVMEGEDDNNRTIENPYKSDDDDDDCGCGGDGKNPNQMVAMLMASIYEMMGKDDNGDIEVKAGRVLNSRNMAKLQSAFELLQDVLNSGGLSGEIEKKDYFTITSDNLSVFDLKSILDPVIDFYSLNVEATELGVKVLNFDSIESDAYDALINAME